MGQFFEVIPPSLFEWIRQQKLLFVATAPLNGGHVNVSPKGGEYFDVVDSRTFWYLDLTGSGVETISHLREPGNGRIVVMFNAFTGPPRILRLWGTGTALEYGTPEYSSFVEKHKVKTIDGTRAVIVVDVHQVGTSCGFSVPFYDFQGFRSTLNEFFEKRVASEKAGNKKDGIERYWAYKNQESMDKLPGMKRGVATARLENVAPINKMVGPFAPKQRIPSARSGYGARALLLIALLSCIAGMLLMHLATSVLRSLHQS